MSFMAVASLPGEVLSAAEDCFDDGPIGGPNPNRICHGLYVVLVGFDVIVDDSGARNTPRM